MTSPPRQLAARGWPLVRIGYLAAVFGALAVVGGWRLIGYEDGLGLVELVAGIAALVFLPRRGLPAAVGLAVALDGLFGLRLWETAGGLLATAVVALPVPGRRSRAGTESPLQSPGPGQSETGSPPAAAIQITTIGRFELVWAGEDRAAQLFTSPALTFLWLYLLARNLATGGDLSTRTSVAAELYPSERAEARRRSNLRKRLLALRSTSGPFRDLLVEEGRDLVGLRLDGCAVDFLEVRDLRDRCQAAGVLLTYQLLDEVDRSLARVGFLEFLVGWEDWEQIQTGGKGNAGSLVRQLRRQLDDWRADLVIASARTRIARGEPTRSVALLELALERSPEREDIAEQLTAAYARSGQIGRAADVRSDYQLKGV